MRVRAVVALVLWSLSSSCRREGNDIKAAPEDARSRTPPAPPVATVDRLVGWAGTVVTIEGTVVSGQLSHITHTVPGKLVRFVELAGSKLEIVAYVPSEPACPATVLMTGKVIVATGKVKGPGGGGDYAEPQLDAERWTCR